MKNINKILNEKIKSLILEGLMKKDMSFSELLRYTSLRDHGQLNYHISLMLKEGLIEKSKTKYTKTLLGERMGVYLNQFQSKEMYPIPLVCAIVKNNKGEILILRRAKSPQLGKWGFPGGKIRLGEKITEAAERKVSEETGLKVKAERIAGFFPSIVYQNKKLSFHANIIPVVMGAIRPRDIVKLDENEHDEFKFVNLRDIRKYPLIENNKRILRLIKEGVFVFKEEIYFGRS